MIFGQNKPVFTISAASEASGLHQQTLRLYETRGLVVPARTPGGTRMYSLNDIEKLIHITELTAQGIGGTGIQKVLELEKLCKKQEKQLRELRTENEKLMQLLVYEREQAHAGTDDSTTAIVIRAAALPLARL